MMIFILSPAMRLLMNKITIPQAAIKLFNNKHGHVVAKLVKAATIKQPERAPYIDEDALYLQYNINHSE